MDSLFSYHLIVRNNLGELLKNTSYEDLLTIPTGFNNNMYWNIAHCVATQQLLIYYLSGNDFRIDKYWIERYRKGTYPQTDVTKEEMDDLYFLLGETSKIMHKDYQQHFFTEYKTYSTSMGIDLHSIEDAVLFNNIHEGLHLGYAKAQSRALLGERD